MSKRGENIYQRKDGLWEARYVKEIDLSGKKKYGSVYARSYREVKAKRQTVLTNLFIYQKPDLTKSFTVSALVEEWLCINQNRIKPSTYQRYEGFLKNHIQDIIGHLQMLHISPTVIYEFAVNRINQGLSKQTVNSILIFLHSCFKYGHRQYNLPLPEFQYFSCYQPEMRVFSQEEQKKLVIYLNQNMDIYKFGVLLTLYTGLRVGELCALKWEDIEDDCIHVRHTMLRLQKGNGAGTEIIVGSPKTRKSQRIIPLPSVLLNRTEQFRNCCHGQTYLLGTNTLPIVEPRVMQYKFKQYLKDLDIKDATFHTLRHSFATRCIECDMEIKSLSEILGHSDVKTTLNRYVHSSLNQKRMQMEKLSFLL